MAISKSELKYISFAVAFAFIWFVLAIPRLLEWGVESSSPYLQFLVFNIGLFIFLQIFLKARVSNSSINIIGSIGMISLVMALDILMPPFSVAANGELLKGTVLIASSSDYVIGYFATNLGLSGLYVFLFTYVLAPALLLLIAAHFLPNFVKSLS